MKLSLYFGACALAFLGGLVTGKSAFAENYQAEEVKCLADNIYWEARNQTVKGMFAVGHVTINRVKDSRFPNTVCEVVYQGPTRPSWKDKTKYYPVKNRCQFSWYCDGKADVILKQDGALYDLILMMSFKIYSGKLKDLTDGATHYHADYVRPEWASSKTKTMKIGQHIFYRWEK